MKKIFLLFICTSFLSGVRAQNMEFLDVNNVKAAFWADGSMFWDKVQDPLFEWPKGSGVHVNYVTGLWIGGKAASDSSIHGAYMRYQPNERTDYWPGPLTNSGTIDSSTIALYDKVWKISREDIFNFQQCYCGNPNAPECAGYTIPASIIQWPGNPIAEADGDHLLMDQVLAPFYDANNDGIYNPMDCDYPEIKCDQALFFVFNDKGGSHTESGANPLGIEVRALAYACACDTLNIGLDDAVFLDLDIKYRGSQNIYQTYVGLYTDADIGGAIDDYMGTNVDLGYVYHYNADAFDNPYQGSPGYGALPPAHGIVFLEGPWMNANGIADFWDSSWDPNNPPAAPLQAINAFGAGHDTLSTNATFGITGTGFNDTIVDNERLGLCRVMTLMPFNSDPTPPSLYYNPQAGFWSDNSRMIYGGIGYPAGPLINSPKANFLYPGESDPWNWGTKGQSVTFPWSEFNTVGSGTSNMPGDRRSISSSGPFTLNPGESNQVTFAFVTARSTNPSDSVSLNKLETTVSDIRQVYFSGNMGECINHIGVEDEEKNISLQLFPNPSSGLSWISSPDLSKSTIQVFDIAGRLMQVIQVGEGQTSQPIVTDNYAPGIYLVAVEGKGWKKSLRLVKN